jgi:hypothetical protein
VNTKDCHTLQIRAFCPKTVIGNGAMMLFMGR